MVARTLGHMILMKFKEFSEGIRRQVFASLRSVWFLFFGRELVGSKGGEAKLRQNASFETSAFRLMRRNVVVLDVYSQPCACTTV